MNIEKSIVIGKNVLWKVSKVWHNWTLSSTRHFAKVPQSIVWKIAFAGCTSFIRTFFFLTTQTGLFFHSYCCVTNVPAGPRGKRMLGGKVATLRVGLDTACEMRCYLQKIYKGWRPTRWGVLVEPNEFLLECLSVVLFFSEKVWCYREMIPA